MELAIGVIVFWLSLVMVFGVRAMADAEAERRKREFLETWED